VQQFDWGFGGGVLVGRSRVVDGARDKSFKLLDAPLGQLAEQFDEPQDRAPASPAIPLPT